MNVGVLVMLGVVAGATSRVRPGTRVLIVPELERQMGVFADRVRPRLA